MSITTGELRAVGAARRRSIQGGGNAFGLRPFLFGSCQVGWGSVAGPPHCRYPSLRTHEVGEAILGRGKLENLVIGKGRGLLRAAGPRNDDFAVP